jgi:hypothetical protein
MERIIFHHTFDGTREGEVVQETKLSLKGGITIQDGAELFKHFCNTVWALQVRIEIMEPGIEKEELSPAIGFGTEEIEEEKIEEDDDYDITEEPNATRDIKRNNGKKKNKKISK